MPKNKINRIKISDEIKEDGKKNVFFTFYNRRAVANYKLANRDVDFFIRNSSRNINISLIIIIIALFFSILKVYTVSQYPDKSGYHIAGVNGKVYDLEWDTEKKKKTFDSIVEIRKKQQLEREKQREGRK